MCLHLTNMEAAIAQLRYQAIELAAGKELGYNTLCYGRTLNINTLPLDRIQEICFDQFVLTAPYKDKPQSLMQLHDLPFACVRVTFPQRQTHNMVALDKVSNVDLLNALHSNDVQVTISIDIDQLRACLLLHAPSHNTTQHHHRQRIATSDAAPAHASL